MTEILYHVADDPEDEEEAAFWARRRRDEGDRSGHEAQYWAAQECDERIAFAVGAGRP